jgi:hypothetical protein
VFDGPSFAAAVGLLGGGIGAGVGAVTDAAMSNRRLIFARPVTAKPGNPAGRAIGFHVRF